MTKVPDDYRLEQRNKYLEDIGLKPWEYGVNWTVDNEKKQLKIWKKQRKKYGFDDRETYELHDIYAEWLYSHLKMYKKTASGLVDLTYHTIDFEGRTYTEIEAIDRVLKWTEYFLKNRDDVDKEEKAMKKLQKATRLWSEILPFAWW